MKKKLVYTLMTLSTVILLGCTNKLKEANELFSQGKVEESLVKYEEVLKDDPESQVAVLRIKECKTILEEREKERAFQAKIAQADNLFNSEKFEESIGMYKNILIEQPSNEVIQKKIITAQNLLMVLNNAHKFQIVVETYSVDNNGKYPEPEDIDYSLYKPIFDDLIEPFKKEKDVTLGIPEVLNYSKYNQYVQTGIFPGKDNTLLPTAPDTKIEKSVLKGSLVYKPVIVNTEKNYEIYGINDKGELMKTVRKSY